MSSRRPMKYQNLQRTGCNRHCDLGFHHLVSLHHKLSTALWKCFNIDVQYWVVFILKVTKQINPGRWLNTEGLLSYPIWNQSRNRKIISLSFWNNISCQVWLLIPFFPLPELPWMKKSWGHYSTLLFKEEAVGISVGISLPFTETWYLTNIEYGSMNKEGMNVGKDLALFLSVTW